MQQRTDSELRGNTYFYLRTHTMTTRIVHTILFTLFVGLLALTGPSMTAQTTGEGAQGDRKGQQTAADGDFQIIRDVNGSGGQAMKGGLYGLHGTVSQTTIGRTTAGNQAIGVGFWYWAREINAFVCVRMGDGEANPGETLRIPLLLEQVENFPAVAPSGFYVRIRYNRSLLQPQGDTPGCEFEGTDCIIEFNGTLTPAMIANGVLAEFEFLAKLGDAEDTPLIIEEFRWTGLGEGRITTQTKNGLFTLLGICREGGEIRLVHAAGPASRLRVFPNPIRDRVTVEYTSRREGSTTVVLVDQFGREVLEIAADDVESNALQRVETDLGTMPSGAYFMVLRTPDEIKTVRVVIEQ